MRARSTSGTMRAAASLVTAVALALGVASRVGAQTSTDQPAELAEPQRQAIPKPGPTGAPVVTEFTRAERLLRRGELAGALNAVEQHLRSAPNDIPGRFLRGVILTDMKRTEEAIAIFTELTLQHPQLPEPFNNLAVLYAGAGQLDRARTALEQAAGANPNSATVQENLGDLYVRLAREAYERASTLNPARTALHTKLQAIRALPDSPNTAPSPSPNGANQ